MTIIRTLAPYADELGNIINYNGSPINNVEIHFLGSNNTLTIDSSAKFNGRSVFRFDCSDAVISIGRGLFGFSCHARVGQNSVISIGDYVTSSGRVMLSALEGTKLVIGPDVMLSADVQIRCDDEHPIFDILSGLRINVSRSISIGGHVWLGWGCRILAGSKIGAGSVVGTQSVVKGNFPNNCVIVGSPSRVTRRNIAWERDHLSLKKPFFKPDASFVAKSIYWNETVEIETGQSISENNLAESPLPSRRRSIFSRLRGSS